MSAPALPFRMVLALSPCGSKLVSGGGFGGFPCGSKLVSGGGFGGLRNRMRGKGFLQIWNVKSGECIGLLDGLSEAVRSLVYLPSPVCGMEVLSCEDSTQGGGSRVRGWNISTIPGFMKIGQSEEEDSESINYRTIEGQRATIKPGPVASSRGNAAAFGSATESTMPAPTGGAASASAFRASYPGRATFGFGSGQPTHLSALALQSAGIKQQGTSMPQIHETTARCDQDDPARRQELSGPIGSEAQAQHRGEAQLGQQKQVSSSGDTDEATDNSRVFARMKGTSQSTTDIQWIDPKIGHIENGYKVTMADDTCDPGIPSFQNIIVEDAKTKRPVAFFRCEFPANVRNENGGKIWEVAMWVKEGVISVQCMHPSGNEKILQVRADMLKNQREASSQASKKLPQKSPGYITKRPLRLEEIHQNGEEEEEEEENGGGARGGMEEES